MPSLRFPGVSFLPRLEAGAFPQMPYEQITQTEYDSRVSELSTLRADQIVVTADPEKFCDTDACGTPPQAN